MNASLTIRQNQIATRRPARASWLARVQALIAALFTADDPAALRYSAAKYQGEID